jgi:hypothetical protein
VNRRRIRSIPCDRFIPCVLWWEHTEARRPRHHHPPQRRTEPAIRW